ncbi:UNVERIFIED_CONTAM: hypothetical protein HDU68_012878 [Siphonaria sp. JEL0065]|nr:hypothetical protein HDU68_012878 [Siphonaria sp. JEL0065]
MCGGDQQHPNPPHVSEDLWQHIHDVHCHVIDTPDTLPLLRPSCNDIKTTKLWIMGTKPDDWDIVQTCSIEYGSRVVSAFGIHPWFAHTIQNPTVSLDSLKSRLELNSSALVGEIGLDGVATHTGTSTKYDMDTQYSLFTQQWVIAASLKRPVSIHAVGCFGRLEGFFKEQLEGVPKDLSKKQRHMLKKARELDEEREERDPNTHPSLVKWPPAIMLHSYSGSTESIRNILRYPTPVASRFYFSFSYFVNSRTPFERMKEKILAVPDDRILVESDLDNVGSVDDACALALDLVARAKGWTLEDAALRTGRNAVRFLSRVGV